MGVCGCNQKNGKINNNKKNDLELTSIKSVKNLETYKNSINEDERIEEGYTPGKIELLKDTELKELEKCICKIESQVNKKIDEKKTITGTGTGFFCKIKHNKRLIPVLITNYHIINDDYIQNNKFINIYIKDDKHTIYLNKNSKIYSSDNNKYDIMIIKLNEDNNDITNYLEIDYKNMNKENSLSNYEIALIYLLHFPYLEKSAFISYGDGICQDQKNKYDIKHLCNTDIGSSGGPILNSVHKVIGIHKGFRKTIKIEESYNIGTYIKFPLDELNKKNYISNEINFIIKNQIIKPKLFENINEINIKLTNEKNNGTKYDNIRHDNKITCVYNIKEKGIINILNDFNVEYRYNKSQTMRNDYHNNRNNINSENTDIFINGKKIKFTQKYKFEEAGLFSVKFMFKKLLKSTKFMFYNCSFLKSIDLSSFDSTELSTMKCMLCDCTSLELIDIYLTNTNNLTDISGLFINCSSLQMLDLSSFNVSNVVDMNCLFGRCSSLKSLNLSAFDTKNVIDMSCMFDNCSSLKSLDLSSFDTKNVEDVRGMFESCSSLEHTNLSTFNTEKVTHMNAMFCDCPSLKSLDLSSFTTKNVKSFDVMFRKCSSLESLDLSSFETPLVTDMTAMFFGCSSLKLLDLSLFDTSNLKFKNYMFNLCNSLEKQNIMVGEKGRSLLDDYDKSIIKNTFTYLYQLKDYTRHYFNNN